MSLRRALLIIHRLEDGLVACLLVLMIGLAVTQIALRNFFDSGLLWADSLLRVLVLWIALIGAIVASRERQHISMDLVTRFLSPRQLRYVSSLTGLFTAAICSGLAWYTWDFVTIERKSPTIAFAGIPSWWCELVMPAAFALIACRYLLQSLTDLLGAPVSDEKEGAL